MRGTWLVVVATIGGAGTLVGQQHQNRLPSADRPAVDRTPLYDNLGTYHMAVTTGSPVAQRYFDQGLRLTYGFNHDEAVKSYREGIREDSACAMCWWGIAYALGTFHKQSNIYQYIDAAHHGWIGWPSNFGPSADLFALNEQAPLASGRCGVEVEGKHEPVVGGLR